MEQARLQASEYVVAAGKGQAFAADMRVSSRSEFSHNAWFLFEDDIPRLALYTENLLKIVWQGPGTDAGCRLPAPVILVLKSFSFLYLNEPSSVIARATTASNHPRTVCQTMHTFLAFLGHVFESQALPGDDDDFTFAQLTLKHIRRSLKSWGGGNQARVKRVLSGLTSILMTKVCAGLTPTWTEADMETLDFKSPTPRKLDDYVLPGPLFRLISNSATATVCGFTKLLGREPICGEGGRLPAFLQGKTPVGLRMLDAYIELRHARASESGRAPELVKPGNACAATLDTRFRKAYACTAREYLNYLHEVHRAACAIVALYTGCRYSDLTFFLVGCVEKKEGMYFLMGTHAKHQDIRKPMGQDPWPAIPVMRDAVAALEELSRVSLSPYLLSSMETSGEKRAYSPNGLLRALQDFLEEVDVDGTWSDVRLSTQRFRNTLAHQLARADVALPFISRHLKHLNATLNSLPAAVTMTYGGIASLKVERAVQAQGLRASMARSFCEKDAPVAGGGGPEYMELRKEYYRGRMEAGMTEDEVCDELVALGMPLSSIGPGFCKGRKDIVLKDGTKRKPHCIGSMECSPGSCHNALITRVHKAVWLKVERQNERFSLRPELAYAREEHLATMKIAQGVLQDLSAVR